LILTKREEYIRQRQRKAIPREVREDVNK